MCIRFTVVNRVDACNRADTKVISVAFRGGLWEHVPSRCPLSFAIQGFPTH